MHHSYIKYFPNKFDAVLCNPGLERMYVERTERDVKVMCSELSAAMHLQSRDAVVDPGESNRQQEDCIHKVQGACSQMNSIGITSQELVEGH